MLKVRLSITFSLLLLVQLNAQTENESKQDESFYNQKTIDSFKTVYASGNSSGVSMSLDILKKSLIQDTKLKGDNLYYGCLANHFFRTKNDSAIFVINKALNYYKNNEANNILDEHLLIPTYFYKGKILAYNKVNDSALIYFNKALDLTKKYSYKWKGYIKTGIASLHLQEGNNKIALKNYLSIIDDTTYLRIPRNPPTLYNRIGLLYDSFNNLDSAKYYYNIGITKAIEKNYTSNLFALYGNIGKIHKKENNLDSTVYFFNKASQSFRIKDNKNSLNDLWNRYYKAFNEYYLENTKNALRESLLVLEEITNEISIDSDSHSLYNDNYDLLKIIYSNQKNTAALQEIEERKGNYLEAYYKKKLQSSLIDLDRKYETKQKDDSIAQLKKDGINQAVILNQKTTINWILICLLIIIIISAFLLAQQRQQKNKLKAVNLEQRLLRSQLNPHFLFNALNTASSLAVQNSPLTIKYISGLGNLLRSILENSRHELISLEEEIQTLNDYLNLQSNFGQKFSFNISKEKSIDHEECLIPPMFIQPFVENAIEHGFQNTATKWIHIDISQSQNLKSLHISIKNNGIPYSESLLKRSRNHKSLSGEILQDRLSLYGREFKTKAYYKIEDLKEETGTLVNLFLPFIKDI